MFKNNYGLTILEQMFKSEIKDFTDTFKSTSSNLSIVQEDTSIKGSVIYPIDLRLQSVVDLLANTSYCQSATPIVTNNYQALFDNVTKKILTIEGEYTFKAALEKVLPFIEKAGPNFYGVLFRNGNTIINPFNIAAVLSHITFYGESSPKFKIMLYFYPNRSELDNTYNTHEANIEMINTNIDNVLKSRASKVEINTNILEAEADDQGRIMILTGSKVKTVSKQSYNANKENYIIAHQGITRGVVAPYYGYSALAKDKAGPASGFHLSPFLCANISYSAPRNMKETINYTSVCTGSQPRNTLKGLTALTQCNMLSPYNRNIILNGALKFADICIQKSLEIYHKAKLIPYIPTYTEVIEDLPEELINIYEKEGLIGVQEYYESTLEVKEAVESTKNFIAKYNKLKGQQNVKTKDSKPTTDEITTND